MKKIGEFASFTRFEACLWAVSASVTVLSYILSPEGGFLNFLASFIGVTAVIFVAKGRVFGQVLSCVFALLYGYISLKYRYYGELITYMGMTFPMGVAAVVSWVRNPYEDSKEVEVAHLNKKKIIILSVTTVIVTVAFYFILGALNTENLTVSTFSIATSFAAAGLTFLRSPYYALAYGLNDIVLIVMWTLAAMEDPSYVLMVICFVTFLANDSYAYYNWKRMRRRQGEKSEE